MNGSYEADYNLSMLSMTVYSYNYSNPWKCVTPQNVCVSDISTSIGGVPISGSVTAQCIASVSCIGNISNGSFVNGTLATMIDWIINKTGKVVNISMCGMFDNQTTCKQFCSTTCVQANGSF